MRDAYGNDISSLASLGASETINLGLEYNVENGDWTVEMTWRDASLSVIKTKTGTVTIRNCVRPDYASGADTSQAPYTVSPLYGICSLFTDSVSNPQLVTVEAGSDNECDQWIFIASNPLYYDKNTDVCGNTGATYGYEPAVISESYL